MLYYLANKDNNKYVAIDNSNKFCYTSDLMKAKLFTLKKAQNLISSSLTKWNVFLYEYEKEYKGMKDYISDVSEQEYQNYVEIENKYSTDTILDVLDNLPVKIQNRKIKLNNQLIKVSRALTDIEHYKEFKPRRSASAKCNLDTFETKCLLKRREIKDEIYMLECAEERLKGNNKVVNLNDRTYVPRELNKLFECDEISCFEEWWED